MSIEAMKQALEALEQDNPLGRSATITALRTAIADTEKQEPVAWMYKVNGMPRVTFCDQREVEKAHPEFEPSKPLFIIPPPRQWVGLTDEDLSVCDEDGVILARYWEAKLKEKNA